MLESIKWREGDEILQINKLVRHTDRPVRAFRARMEQLQTLHEWLAGYLHAASIMIQIPGGAEYCWRECDDDVACTLEPARSGDRDERLTILAATLQRLGASELISQVPDAEQYVPCILSAQFRVALAGLDRQELLRVAADCLDHLLVIPHLPDELAYHEPLRRPGILRRAWRRLRLLRGGRQLDPLRDGAAQ